MTEAKALETGSVLIPLISGQPIGLTIAGVAIPARLNPFDIRAADRTSIRDGYAGNLCLNPFDIRAADRTYSEFTGEHPGMLS